MKGLIWSRPAEADLLGIASHYCDIDDAVARRMLLRIEQAPLILLSHPRLGSPTIRPAVRKLRVPMSSFGLLYVGAAEDVEIRRVIHLASEWRAAS